MAKRNETDSMGMIRGARGQILWSPDRTFSDPL